MTDDDDLMAVIHLDEDEVPLLTFLATTRGVHVEPRPILEVADPAEQAAIVREVAAQLRETATQLEARAGLVDAVESIEEGMRP